MTRRRSTAEPSLRAALTKVSARLIADGKAAPLRFSMGTPSRPFTIPPGHERVVVAMRRPDGTRLDRSEARASLDDRPYAHLLEWRGLSRGLHVFSYDPRRLTL